MPCFGCVLLMNESKAHPGIFHMLPLGQRVQDKIEALIDKYMRGIGEFANQLAIVEALTNTLSRCIAAFDVEYLVSTPLVEKWPFAKRGRRGMK